MMSLRWPVRSAGVNFALAYGAVFILSAGLFLSFLWWNTSNRLDRHVQATVEADARDLARHWSEGGVLALAMVIRDRLEQNIDDDELYLLVDRQGQRYAGNLPGWPVIMTSMERFYEMPVIRDGMHGRAKLHAYLLPGGYRLIVGRDIRGRALLHRQLADTLIWSGVMLVLLTLGGGLAVRHLFRQVVSSLARTTSAVAGGDLSRRMALTGSETDLVAQPVNAMLDRINRLMDGVKQVSNAIAHDLRTPITRARSRLEDAAHSARSEAELRAAIDQAVGDLDHVVSLFEALLRISQLEAGARRAAFKSLDLVPLLIELGEFYEVSAEEAGLGLRVEVPSAPLPLTGDRHLLQQAVANLLDNAVKFSSSGTGITLSAERRGPDIVLSVADQGPGMSEAELARAPERFFRADAARHKPGAGLGLSLVEAVATLHGGRLVLRASHPGLQAVLTLPALPSVTPET